MKINGKSEKSCYKGGYKRGTFYRKWEEEFAVGEAICPMDAIYFHRKCDICAGTSEDYLLALQSPLPPLVKGRGTVVRRWRGVAVGVYSIMRYVASAIPYNSSFAVNPVGNGALDIPLIKCDLSHRTFSLFTIAYNFSGQPLRFCKQKHLPRLWGGVI